MAKFGTAKEKDPADPSNTSLAWDAMIDVWEMVDTLLEGTNAMREAGPTYLPVHAAETATNYEERLFTNVLFNATEITLDHFVGRPFSDPVRLNSDVPADIATHTENIDLLGNDMTTFCREWFSCGLAKGFCHVMIDMPGMNPDAIPQTLEDDRESGRRPFWMLIQPENMIFAEAEIIVDPVTKELRDMYTHVRLREDVIERQGFAEVIKKRIRIIEPNHFEVWEKIRNKKKKEDWVMIDQGDTGIDFVPIVTYYSQRTGFLTSKPPMQDLAFLNIRHWQSMADQINILTVVRFPILAVAGSTETGGASVTIGPRQLLSTRDANGKFYYVEHSGASINAGWDELSKLEDDMEAYGAAFLKKDPGNETATARALDSVESVSPLQDMTIRFIDSVNNALRMHAAWMNKKEGGTVKITTDFGDDELNPEMWTALHDLRSDRDISRQAVIKQAKKLGVLSEDYDADADFKQIVIEDKDLKPLQPQVPGTFDPSEEDGKERDAPNNGSSDDDTGTPRAKEEK